MKLRDLIKELVNHDMDSDVTVHAANGTVLLRIESIHDHKERTLGDSNEPRLTLVCYKSQEPAAANAATLARADEGSDHATE